MLGLPLTLGHRSCVIARRAKPDEAILEIQQVYSIKGIS